MNLKIITVQIPEDIIKKMQIAKKILTSKMRINITTTDFVRFAIENEIEKQLKEGKNEK